MKLNPLAKNWPQFMITQNQWSKLFTNSVLLIANTLIGSVLGVLFWTVATDVYDPTELGLAAAYMAAMGLLVKLGEMGLGPTLIRFLPSMKNKQVNFVNSSLIAVAGSTFILIIVFVKGTPIWSPELLVLSQNHLDLVLFVSATLSFNLAQLLDRLYIAFEATGFLLIRNLLADVLRVVLVIIVGHQLGAAGLLFAVSVGAFVTLGLSAIVFAPRVLPSYQIQLAFDWSLLWEKARYSLGNHFSLLLWNAPSFLYPLVIINLLGAEANAYFYISWMIANFLFVVPTAISTATFASASNQSDMSDKKYQQIVGLSLIGLLPLVIALIVSSTFLLAIFGQEYVTNGHTLLILLVISVFPYTINSFFITFFRIYQKIDKMILFSIVSALLSLISVMWGSIHLNLIGAGVGWLVSQSFLAILTALLNMKYKFLQRENKG